MTHRSPADSFPFDAASTSGLLRALALVTLLLAAGAAHSATIFVTTSRDSVSNDGLCSLREAVSAASMNTPFNGCPAGHAAPTVDVIQVPRGTYTLRRGSYGEDDNAEGDLDITESVIAICGDAGVLMNAQEMETARRVGGKLTVTDPAWWWPRWTTGRT